MNLHKSEPALNAIIQKVSNRSEINPSIIEKDYYVSMVLKEIASKQNDVPAYFKGGTCLYKVYMDMKRFSEDIDLTVETSGMTASQAKRTLEKAAHGYESMERLRGDILEENRKGSITSVYGYHPIFEVDDNDRLQRYGKLKIEATSFTISEPYETNTIQPLLFQYATEDEKDILKNSFGVSDFDIKNICIERIFADKILAAEFYIERKEYFDVAKHVYDLSAMLDNKRIREMTLNREKMTHFLSYKRAEEKIRIGSDLAEKPLGDLKLFDEKTLDNKDFYKAYENMQKIYIIKDKDKKPIERVMDDIQILKLHCQLISEYEKESWLRKQRETETTSEIPEYDNQSKVISQINNDEISL